MHSNPISFLNLFHLLLTHQRLLEVTLISNQKNQSLVATGIFNGVNPRSNRLKRMLVYLKYKVLVKSNTIIAAPLYFRYPGIKLRNLYCPAVSQICNLICFPLDVITTLEIKSMPTVDFVDRKLHYTFVKTPFLYTCE